MGKIFKVVDENIKKKYFSGQDVKCIGFKRKDDGGYLAAYQQKETQIYRFHITVKKEGNSIMLGYHLLN